MPTLSGCARRPPSPPLRRPTRRTAPLLRRGDLNRIPQHGTQNRSPHTLHLKSSTSNPPKVLHHGGAGVTAAATLAATPQVMCCGTEAGTYLRLIDSCITQLKAQGPSRTINESQKQEEERRSRRGGITPRATPVCFRFKSNYLAGMCSGSEAGSYLRLIDFCITQL